MTTVAVRTYRPSGMRPPPCGQEPVFGTFSRPVPDSAGVSAATAMRTADRCAEFSDVTGTDVAVGVPFTVATSEVPAGSTMSTWPCANATLVPVGANVSAVPPADTPALIAGSAHVQVGGPPVNVAEMVPPAGIRYAPAVVPAETPPT